MGEASSGTPLGRYGFASGPSLTRTPPDDHMGHDFDQRPQPFGGPVIPARCLKHGAAGLVVLVSVGCGSDGATITDPPQAQVAALSLDRGTLELWVGATGVLAATARDGAGALIEDASLTWTSSDPAVARVSVSGVVTAWGDGTANVTATAESGVSVTAEVTGLGLDDPMNGVLNDDYYYTNYFDQAGGASFQDYRCGPKSYDGHLGLDIVLPDFRTMDEGVDVVAAAPGRVVDTHDGEFDRNKAWGPNPWNVVVLDHDGQLETIYGHLKNGSLTVSVGDIVEAGDKLGEVGSSGRSDMSHLHLELRQRGRAVDPYGGPCSLGHQYFRDPLPYQDEFRLIGADVTREVLDLDRIKDGVEPTDTIRASDDRVTVWAHLHNKAANGELRFELVRPDDVLHGVVDATRPWFFSMSWWWAWWDRTGLEAWPGTWTARVRYEGEVLATRSFHLEGLVAAPLRAPAREGSSGWGGGAVQGDPRGR